MKKIVLSLLAVLMTVMSFAQCFISNSNENLNFYKAYLDVPIVKKASLANGKITNEMLDYICKKSNPADVKYAMLNALGWDGKMKENVEKNSKTLETYLNENYENMGFENILNVLGTSTAMCVALMEAYSDPLQAEHALGLAKSVIEKDYEHGIDIQSTKIMYDLIAIENSMMWVGDVTPMGTQEGFQDAIKDILPLCSYTGDAVDFVKDMRKNALNIIYNILKEYEMEVGKIKIISKSKNPYQISINGEVIGTMDGYETYEHQVSPGYYHIKAVQVSGYAFSPTINNRDVNIEDGQTITVTIGYED